MRVKRENRRFFSLGVVNIEFIISALVFLGTVFFLIISVASNVPQFHEGSLISSLRSRSFSVSEVLLLDEGAPKNWNSGNVKRIGLSTPEKYVVSMQKINTLKGMCSDNYNSVRDLIAGDPNFVVVINITNVETNEVYVYCAPPVATLVLPQSLVKRYGVLESRERVSIEVGVA